MEYIISTTIYLLKGTYTTLSLYFVTALFSMPLSMLFAALQFSAPKFIRYIFDIYAWIFRGTPLILQLIFFYYGLPLMTNNFIAFPAFTSAAITFILNYSAYLMEIFRASGLSVKLSELLAIPLSYIGIPKELCELLILRPLSGSGSLAVVEKIFSEYGVDSYVARSASVIMASNDTIFYIAAVYLSSCKDKSAGAAIAISLVSSLMGAICACLLCRVM